VKVLYLPGLLGSNLTISLGGDSPSIPLWLDLASILAGGLALLDLSPDGLSPGPLAGEWIPRPAGVWAPVYGELELFMRGLGWDVYSPGYDWRLSVVAAAEALYPSVISWAAGQPIYIVAHSQGGLVARSLYAEMVSSGLDAQLTRLVTLCTPHYGSLEPVRLWWRQPRIYQGLMLALGWVDWLAGQPGPAYLERVLASWPCWYELTANLSQGPLFQAAPQQAIEIYTGSFYSGANPYWSQAWATAGAAVQTLLAGSIPAGRTVCVVGVGSRTPYQLDPTSTPDRDDGYLYTYQGDGLVTADQATLPGVPVLTVTGEHAVVVLKPSVWAALSLIVPNGLSASVVLG
jgi:hypothetical protein